MKLPESIFYLCVYDIHRLKKAITFGHEVSKWSDEEKWEFYRDANLLSLFIIRMRQDPGFCRYVLDEIRKDEKLISSAIEYVHALKSEWCFNYSGLYKFSLKSSSDMVPNEVISEINNDEIEKFRFGYYYLRPFGDGILKKAINYSFINSKEDFENKKAATYLIRHESPGGDEFLLSAYDVGFSHTFKKKWINYSLQNIVRLYNYYPLNAVSSPFIEYNKNQRREDTGEKEPFDKKIAGHQGNIPFLKDLRKKINESFNCGFPENKWIYDSIWSESNPDSCTMEVNSRNLQDLAFSTHTLSILCELWFSQFNHDERCKLLNKSYPFRYDNDLLDDMPKALIDIAITDGNRQIVDTKPLYQYCVEHDLPVTLNFIESGLPDAQYFNDLYQEYCDCVLSGTFFERKYDDVLKRFDTPPSKIIRDFQFENKLQFAHQLNEISIKQKNDKKIGAYVGVFQYYTGDYDGAIQSFNESFSEYQLKPEYFQFLIYHALSYIALDSEKGLDIITDLCSSIKNNKLTDIEFLKIFGYELITLEKDPIQYLNPLCTHLFLDSSKNLQKIIGIYAELALFNDGRIWCDENISKLKDSYEKASLILAKGKLEFLEGKTEDALTAFSDAQNMAEEIYRHDMLINFIPPFPVNSAVNGSYVEIFSEKDLLGLPDLYAEDWSDQDTLLINETNALLEIKDFSGVRKSLNKLGKYGYVLNYSEIHRGEYSDVFETFIVVEDYLSQSHIQSDLIVNCDDAKTAFFTAETLQLKFTKEFDRSEEFDYSPVLTMIGKGVELLVNKLIMDPVKSEIGSKLRKTYSPNDLPFFINNWLDNNKRTMSSGQFAGYVLRDMHVPEKNFQLFTDALLLKYPLETLTEIGEVLNKIAYTRNSVSHGRIINQFELRSEWNSAVDLVNQLLKLLFNTLLSPDEILPLDSDVLTKLAEISIKKKQTSRARWLCNQAIKSDQLNINAYLLLGSLHKELKSEKAYSATLKKIKKYRPHSELLNLARDSFKKGNYSLAVEKYCQLTNSRIIKKDPNLISMINKERENAIIKLEAAKTELREVLIQVSNGTHIGFENNENLLRHFAILNYHTGNFKKAYNILLNLGIFEKEDLSRSSIYLKKRIFNHLLGEDYRYGYYLAELLPEVSHKFSEPKAS